MSDLSEKTLMQSIKDTWGTLITSACESSSVPAGFLAALVANESGGHNDARRFEPKVLASLWEVLLGRKAAYGSIGRAVLVNYVGGLSDGTVTSALLAHGSLTSPLPADAFQRVDGLATSWGLTQIMGYHVLGTSHDLDDLKTPEPHLAFSLRMLAAFAEEFSLDVTKDFEELFRCWNTGRPDGQTFDQQYANNGLVRMAVWSSLA